MPPTYANIALLRAWLDAWSGRTDLRYAEAVVDEFRRHGCFVEHNSPTYYGIDLLALGLWQRADSPVELQRWGASIEAALWTDIARWWHPELGNLCGPYSRAYGMDLHAYVSGLAAGALVCRPAGSPPRPAVDPLPHGHDLCVAPLLQHVGVRPPVATSCPPSTASPVRTPSNRWCRTRPAEWPPVGSTSTAWSAPRASDAPLHARGQYHPATVHWRLPDGAVGWLRLVHHGPTRATASEARLDVECEPHPRRGPAELRWESNTLATEVRADHWSFPGLEVSVDH